MIDLNNVKLIFPCPICKNSKSLIVKVCESLNTGMITCTNCNSYQIVGTTFHDSSGELTKKDLLEIGINDLIDRFNLGDFKE